MLTVTDAEKHTVEYQYDAMNRRTLASAANGTLAYTFEYDPLNRLTEKLDSRGRSLAFSYDAAGNLLTKTTYQGSTTRYTYDGAGTLVAISNPDYLTVNYQYDAAGRLLSRVMSSGARSLYGYDDGGRLEEVPLILTKLTLILALASFCPEATSRPWCWDPLAGRVGTKEKSDTGSVASTT